MIKTLLIEGDPKNRDIVKTGLDQFQAFEVDHAFDDWGVDMAREKDYDLVVANLQLANGADGMAVVKSIREFDRSVEIILMTRGRTSKLLTKEKQASNLFGLLHLPVDELAFFKLLSRLRDRLQTR